MSNRVNFYTENQLLDPKPPIGVFNFPCGYLDDNGELSTDFEVREINGNDEDLLASRQIADWDKTGMLITNCMVRIGGVNNKPSLARCVDELALGDQVFAMLAIRRVTVGDIFPFEESCPKGHKDFYTMDLSALTVKPMADPTRRVYTTKLPSGKVATWHVMKGKDQKRIAPLLARQEKDKVSIGVSARLDLINDTPVDLNTIKNLSMNDRNTLRDDFEEKEGGVDTTLTLLCRQCNEEYQAELDISRQGFFSPSAALKVLKKKYSI